MLVAQLSDIHIGFDRSNPDELNVRRFNEAIQWLAAMNPLPDIAFLTGDLTEHGDIESYQKLRSAIASCPFPVFPLLGNHDVRANFIDVFPEVERADGFVQYVIETQALRFIILDTLEEGRHGGGFCMTRAAWLRARLVEAPHRPTMIVLHHPPIETGIGWMTNAPDEPWITMLDAAMAGQTQVIGMICGHIHRAIATAWRGRALSVCPSSSPQVALELSDIDPDFPDDRPMIIEEDVGAALHLWNGRSLVTHFANIGNHAVLARYNRGMQPLVQHLLAESEVDVMDARTSAAA